MRTKLLVLSAGLSLAAAAPAFAHHAFAAEFDDKKPIIVTGTVSKLEWMNPHIWLYVDGKDENGKTATWAFEGGPPAFLIRAGWTRNALKPGDTVTIRGFRAKDGSTNASSRQVTLPDGKKVFAGTADDGGPQAQGAKQ
jgi:hypothetical protein